MNNKSFMDSELEGIMKEKKILVYEGEVKDDGRGGVCLGEDSIASISEKLESLIYSGKKIKVKIEYYEDA